MKIRGIFIYALIVMTLFSLSCNKDETPPEVNKPKLILKYKFDSTQVRLDNFGNPASIPAGNAAQSPVFHNMGVHYIELSKQNDIPAYSATQLYLGGETTAGGATAIDFNDALYGGDGDIFFKIPLEDIPAGTYPYLRISLSYQNYDISYRASGFDLVGRLASFIGYNTYIEEYQVKDSIVSVYTNKLQGYWAFEAGFPGVPVIEGQSPPGATTVPNPLFATSAIPAGSCLVTGAFATPLTITGNETENIVITCSISTNNSFEWDDSYTPNGIYEPADGDTVVDMGIRGLIPIVE